MRKTLFIAGAIGALIALATLAVPDLTIITVKPAAFYSGWGLGASLHALLEPALIAATAAIVVATGWPYLREAIEHLRGSLAAGRAWCLRVVQDLRQPHYEHVGLHPRYMTGLGPHIA